MDEGIFQIAEQIVQLNQKAYEVYLPLVDVVCTYPSCIEVYIEAYREMWEEESSYSEGLL